MCRTLLPEQFLRLVQLVLDGSQLAQQRPDVALVANTGHCKPKHMNLRSHPGKGIVEFSQRRGNIRGIHVITHAAPIPVLRVRDSRFHKLNSYIS